MISGAIRSVNVITLFVRVRKDTPTWRKSSDQESIKRVAVDCAQDIKHERLRLG